MVLRAGGARQSASSAEIAGRFEPRGYVSTKPAENVEPAAGEEERHASPDPALVSIVLVHDGADDAALGSAIEACRAQTWQRTELVVFDRREASALADALERTTGELVGFTDTAAPLRPTAVELALSLPPGSRFFRSFGEERYAEHERALLGR
jgi:hypothetical protein